MKHGSTVLALVSSVIVALAWTVSSSPGGENWPRFRGPNGTGTSESTSIPASWTTDDYRWRVELPGIGYSSCVVWEDRLFVTCALEEDATQNIRCLRTLDGGMVWEREFESAAHPKHQFNCYASSTPAVDAEHVYYCFATPEKLTVMALDQQRGGDVWRRDLGPFVAEHAFGASPIVFEGMVIVPNEQDGKSSIVALDRETGKTRWVSPRRTEKTAYATPSIYHPEEGPAQLITNSWAHGVSSLDPRTGKTNWEQSVFRYRVVGSPAIADGLVIGYAGGGGRGHQMIAVKPGNPATGATAEVVYEVDKPLPYVCTPVGCGDLLFVWCDGGVVKCLHASTGEIFWEERVGGDYFGSPVVVGGRLYCISRKGEMVVLSASREFKELGRIDLEERSNSTPAVADGVMYLRTASHVMAIGGETEASSGE